MSYKKLAGGLLTGLITVLALWPGDTPPPGEAIVAPAVSVSEHNTASGVHAFPLLSPAAEPQPLWHSDQVLVSVSDRESLADIADEHGSTVLREGRSAAALSVPEGLTPAEFRQQLQSDPRVRHASPQGITRGAGLDPQKVQWHIQSTDFDHAGNSDVSSYVVAVLDTGVAYEDWSDESGSYVQAPSLSATAFVAPRDFVNADDHPNDDHQHGTHIASIIASQGEWPGVVPGVSVMPLKVLDANNAGTELDLIEAIWWAVENGADVINMSLTFGPGYAPSPSMQEALEAAAKAGVVMVGAAGNDALSEVGWPAASPLVIAVGSGCPSPGHNQWMYPAPYSNQGSLLDIVAPGGCVDRDDNGDGLPDGVIGETIGHNSPGEVGYWLYAGTSQAAAIISGAAVRLLDAGSAPEDVRPFLQDYADDADIIEGGVMFAAGLGPGQADVEDSVNRAHIEPERFSNIRYHAAVMPWLADPGDGTVVPRAQVTVLEDDMGKAGGVTVIGRFTGSTSGPFSCYLSNTGDGECTVSGPPIDAGTSGGALAWQVTVDRVLLHDESYTPGPLMFASEALDAISESILNDEPLQGAVLGVYWEAGEDAQLGGMAESLVVLNAGTGIATSPMGTIITRALIDDIGEEVSLNGTGIATSPFGIRRIDLGGTGIATSPFSLLPVVALNGTGIATSPFGARSVLTLSGAEGADWQGDDFQGEPLALTSPDDAFTGTAIGAAVLAGGWVSSGGIDGASVVAGSSVISSAPPVEVGSGAGAGAVPMPE